MDLGSSPQSYVISIVPILLPLTQDLSPPAFSPSLPGCAKGLREAPPQALSSLAIPPSFFRSHLLPPVVYQGVSPKQNQEEICS